MADGVDLIARWMAGLGLGLSVVNTVIAVRKDRRERRALLPIVAVDWRYEEPRRIAVDVTITNPLKRPIILERLEVFEGGLLWFIDAPRGDERRHRVIYNEIPPEDMRVPQPKTILQPETTGLWEGVILVPDRLPSPLNERLDLRVYFDLRDGAARLHEQKFITRL